MLGQTAQAKSLHVLQQRLNHQGGDQAPVQMARYQAKQATEGVAMDVELVHGPGQIEIIDHLDREGKPRASGLLTYQVDPKGSGWELMEFEAQPAGTGLGSLLLFEFAHLAVQHECPVIRVAAPALSAMGAYVAFGGKIGKPETFKQTYGVYKENMSARPEDKDSEDEGAKKKYEAGFMSHKSLVEAEASTFAEQKVAREKYFNPDMSKEELREVGAQVAAEHVASHPYGPDELERLAYYAGLSATLVYEPSQLQEKTAGMWGKKWALVQPPQPSKKKNIISKFLDMF